MTPSEAAEKRYQLSVEYGNLSEELEAILLRKTDQWRALRTDTKSDTAADRIWDATPDGKREIHLTMSIKRNEKESSALSSLIRIKEGEAKNLW
jgi:hypothetical protein